MDYSVRRSLDWQRKAEVYVANHARYYEHGVPRVGSSWYDWRFGNSDGNYAVRYGDKVIVAVDTSELVELVISAMQDGYWSNSVHRNYKHSDHTCKKCNTTGILLESHIRHES